LSEQLTTWAGRTLHGTDRFGQWITLESTWDDTPDTKGEEEDRPNADGEYDLPIFYAARYITVTGHLHTASHAKTHEAMHWFNGAMTGRFVVSGHGPTLWCDAKRNSGTKFTIITDTFAQWQIKLKAVNPRKFGASNDFVRTNGTVSVFHRGNYGALPTVIVRGSAANGYRINGPGGKQYKVSRALVTGVPHRIEFRDGLLRVDGNLVPDGVDRADVWPVPAGTATDFDINVLNGGTAEATITVTDTYI
jgi:hypothetical protein